MEDFYNATKNMRNNTEQNHAMENPKWIGLRVGVIKVNLDAIVITYNKKLGVGC